MGQYFVIANVDKREYLHPHCFGDGLKLMEFGSSGDGTMLGLALLLRCSNEGGGGDFHGDIDAGDLAPCLGRWAFDKIVIVGDYDSSGLFETVMKSDEWTNISDTVRELMRQDSYVDEQIAAHETRRGHKLADHCPCNNYGGKYDGLTKPAS